MPPEALCRRIAALPASPHSSQALDRLLEAADRQNARECLDSVLADAQVLSFLGTVLGDCPYLLDLASKDTRRLAAILSEAPEERLKRQIAGLVALNWETRPEAMSALRRAKQDVALALALADLARATPLETTTGALSAFADAALAAALRFALSEAVRSGRWSGKPEACGFYFLALGKQGAHELNYSSDIDVMALYEPAARGLSTGVEPSTFWVKIVRAVVALLQERTADGYVFRTDLRLRPDPGATPVALSAPAALLYYESMGQNWERAALIKARAAAGDIAAGEAFVAELAPFIWRKYLDFAAIADIHSIKRQVHAHRGHAAVEVPGHDIKRGRGGIREIEFFVQTQQLIAGGRDRMLRGRATRPMLRELAAKGWINETTRRELDDAYVFLRMLEHRLQMVRDEQTHTLPRDREGLARMARLTGHADPEAFEAELRSTLETVARHYSELFEDAPELSGQTGSLVFTGGEDDPETLQTLRRLGFANPEHVTETVRAWHFGRFPAMRSTAARESLTEITPAFLQAFSRAGNPDAGLHAFDNLLRALPAGAQLFALLTNNRELLDLLATILGAAPRLAEIFVRRPHVVDAILDPRPLGETEGAAGLSDRLETSLGEASSYEDVLNRARLFAAEHRFRICIGLLRGTLSPAAAGKAFSDLAEIVVRALFERTVQEFERQHGSLPDGRTAILAFGRLGSREMTAGSDLDLIVIYDHNANAVSSDGKRPLAPSQYYTRLTQRVVAALSAPTAEGVAYLVDLRLRPSGQAGPLATHIESFEQYQLNDAWTWEHMAVSRGRPIAGDPELVRRVADVLDRIVALPRDREKLAADIAQMRGRIELEKSPANSFDVKLARGGLLDCEFAAQYLILAGLGRRAGEMTLETLERGAMRGAWSAEAAEALIESAALQGGVLQVSRAAGEAVLDPAEAPDALRRLLVSAGNATASEMSRGGPTGEISSFEKLQERLEEAQERTRAALELLLGAPVG